MPDGNVDIEAKRGLPIRYAVIEADNVSINGEVYSDLLPRPADVPALAFTRGPGEGMLWVSRDGDRRNSLLRIDGDTVSVSRTDIAPRSLLLL